MNRVADDDSDSILEDIPDDELVLPLRVYNKLEQNK